jgi:hypothetical protein
MFGVDCGGGCGVVSLVLSEMFAHPNKADANIEAVKIRVIVFFI